MYNTLEKSQTNVESIAGYIESKPCCIMNNSGEKSSNTVEKGNQNVESSVSQIENTLSSHYVQHSGDK